MSQKVEKVEFDVFTDGWGRVFRTKKLKPRDPSLILKSVGKSPRQVRPASVAPRPTGVNVKYRDGSPDSGRITIFSPVPKPKPVSPPETYIFDNKGIVLYECPVCRKRGLLNEPLEKIQAKAPKVLPEKIVVWPCHKHVKLATERGF